MEIKIYEPKVKVTNESPNATASPGAFTEPARAMQDVGATLGAIGEKMTQAQAFKERTEAANKTREGLQNLVIEAQNDNDLPNTAPKYIEKMKAIRSEAAKGITLAAARREFDSDYSTMSNAALMDIKQDQRKKIVYQGIVTAETAIDQLEAAYLTAGDPIRQEQLQKEIELTIETATSKGFYNPVEGMKKKEERIGKLGIKKFNADLAAVNDPAAAEAIIKTLKAGGYEQNGTALDPETKRAMLGQAEQYRKRYEADALRDQKILQDANEAKYAVALSRKELKDPTILENALLKGEIGREFFEASVKSITTTEKAPNSEKSKAFVELNEKFLSLKFDEDDYASDNDQATLQKFRLDVTNAYNEGKLDSEDFQKWIERTTPDFIDGQKDKFGFMRAGSLLMKNFVISMGGGPAMLALLNKNFLKRAEAASLTDLPKVAPAVINEARAQLDPEAAMIEGEKPGQKTDANGVIRRTAFQKPSSADQKSYSVGDVITNAKGEKAEVTGFNAEGKPLVRRVAAKKEEKDNARA